MSGIAGVVYSDGRTVADSLLVKMADSMAYRGQDGTSFENLGNVGFVHLMSKNLPESINEILPCRSTDNRYLITFHGRIDNRKEIYDLAVHSEPLARLPDSQLVLAAYQVVGKACAAKLLGDFAFAIWDDEERLLFCCRDHMGIKPCFFTQTGSFFAFASEIKALLGLPGQTREVNRERLADFLVCMATERRMTVYHNIFKLEPAHYLIFKQGRITEERYWQLEPYDLHLTSADDYNGAFYELFKEAVKVRLRTSKPIGSFLSGGVDSSSIVCMAAGPLEGEYDGKLQTYTGIYNRLTECDERQYFQSVLDRYPVIPNYLPGDDLSPESAFDQTVLDEDEPFFAPHFFVNWYLFKLARRNGVRVMLDGHDGDSAFSSGEGLLPELAMQGRVVRLALELRCFPHATCKKVLRSIRDIYIDLLRRKLLKNMSTAKRIKLRQMDILSPALLATTRVKERVLALADELPDRLHTEQQRHFFNITQPFHAMALEFLERLSSRFGICTRFPAFDIRLIAFCLSLPAEKKMKDGYDRHIVRKSLQDILPLSVRTRKGKTSFRRNMVDAFTVRSKDWLLDSYHNAPPEVYEYLNRGLIENALNQCMSDVPEGRKLPELTNVLFFLALSKWLKKSGIGG